MRTLLFTTDFSDCANNALEYTLPVADFLRCKIVFLHANNLPAAEVQMADILVAEVMEQKNKQAIAALNTLKFRTSEFAFQNNVDIPVDHILTLGFPGEEILKASDELHPELIVAGTTGEGGIVKYFFGSTTSTLIKKAKYPLLIVPDEAKYAGIKNIAYAAGLEYDDISVVQKLLAFAAQVRAKLFVFHIDTPPYGGNYKMLGEIQENFKQAVATNELIVETMQGEKILSGIDTYLSDRNIDLLAMTHHRKPFAEIFDQKLAQKMVKHTSIPLLIYQQ